MGRKLGNDAEGLRNVGRFYRNILREINLSYWKGEFQAARQSPSIPSSILWYGHLSAYLWHTNNQSSSIVNEIHRPLTFFMCMQ